MSTNVLSLIRDARLDEQARAVARDLLQQHEYPVDRIDDVLAAYTPVVVRSTARFVLDEINSLLLEANGRKWSRTLTVKSVVGSIKTALVDGYGWRHGGYPTASSYGYSYSAVSCAAIVDGDVVYVQVERVRGRTGPWGINALTDRATRPATIERNLQTIRASARDDFALSCSIDVAQYLTRRVRP